jgi:hypothetical protein
VKKAHNAASAINGSAGSATRQEGSGIQNRRRLSPLFFSHPLSCFNLPRRRPRRPSRLSKCPVLYSNSHSLPFFCLHAWHLPSPHPSPPPPRPQPSQLNLQYRCFRRIQPPFLSLRLFPQSLLPQPRPCNLLLRREALQRSFQTHPRCQVVSTQASCTKFNSLTHCPQSGVLTLPSTPNLTPFLL